MRPRTPTTVALSLGILVLAAWRFACVRAGPDVDTDAYAHHMIARAILANPRDLAVHWVWLPLFHYLQVPLVALGGTMTAVRCANVVLAAATPCLLFWYVRGTAKEGDSHIPGDAVALVTALIAAACPIVMQMGTTAQPEPLFALLVLAVAIAYQRGRHAWAAALLGAAALLRYEAWAALLAVACFEAASLARSKGWLKGTTSAPGGSRGWIVVLVPAALILVWAVMRRHVDGRLFGFLGQTRAFATGALHTKSGFEGGLLGAARDALWYPFFVPLRVMGPVLPFVPFGVRRAIREQGGRFVAVLASCLAFVTLSWVMRSTLGLDRHFVVVVPLYATFGAQGIATLGDALADWRSASPNAARLGRVFAAVVCVASLGGLCVALDVWMGFWKSSIQRGWPRRERFGAYLRSLPRDATIFCDDASIEILSGVDRRRFDRHWVDDAHTWDLVAAAARAGGPDSTYVATWTDKMRGHETAGDVLFRIRDNGADASSELSVMRVASDTGHARR
jgi:hypothetical protein